MKNIKQLLLLSILCSLVLFNACSEDEDPVTDDDNTVLDADGDGVADADDTCAETAEGATVDESGCLVNAIYLDENGVTIKATEDAVIGNSYELGGVSYLVVDRNLLYNMTDNEEDVTKVITTNVTDVYGLFTTDDAFNQDIGSWDVGNVTNMNSMFSLTEAFNQDISSWDVSNVTNMYSMFSYATAFNQDIGSWDVGNVTDMSHIFYYARAFNQDISSWDVSNVTNMSYMFDNAWAFDQDIGSWNVDNVTDCERFSTESVWTEPKPTFTNCTE
jgi:surface protein